MNSTEETISTTTEPIVKGIKLSCVIITFNEEKNIKRCLSSLTRVADEILVVDSFSTDKTEEICKSFNVKFIQHPFEGHIQQKNYAISKASFDYVLSLDADEMLSKELEDSVAQIKSECKSNSFSMNRLTNYCGSWIRHCGWYPDRKIRLWNKTSGSWKGENPHDRVVMDNDGPAKYIKGDILHYSYYSFSDHIKQMEKFSTIAAQEGFKKRKKVLLLAHIIFYPCFRFFNIYFLKLGFLDGFPGFVISIVDSFYRFSKYTKLYMLYRQERKNTSND